MTQDLIRMTNTLPEAQTLAWLKMAERKNALTAELTKRELGLQGIVNNVPDDKLATAIAEFKRLHGLMKDERLTFTNAVDNGIVQPLMQFEKRCDPKTYQPFITLTTRELALRQVATDKLKADTELANEIAAFKAHFQNEYTRIVSAVRVRYATIISEAYSQCLEQRIPTANIHSAIQAAISAMGDVKPADPAKFIRNRIEAAKAVELFATINKPDYPQYFRDAVDAVNAKFSLYPNDLANTEIALAGEQQSIKAIVIEEAAVVGSETASNTLIAQAEAFVLPEPGFKSVVELSRIVIVDDNPQWVLLIMTAFIKSFQAAFVKLRVKKYSALTVAQMAAALDAAGIKVDGVQYETIAK